MRYTLLFLLAIIPVSCAAADLTPTLAVQPVEHGLTGYYYQNAEINKAIITGPYDHKTVDRQIDFKTATFDWTPFGMEQRFSVYWNGWLYIDTKRPYSFAVLANGGAEVYVDEVRLVGKSATPPRRWEEGTPVLLDQGYHRIEVIYYSWSPTAGIGLYWDWGQGYYIVPSAQLFPEHVINPVTLQLQQASRVPPAQTLP